MNEATKPGEGGNSDAPVGAPSGDVGAVQALRKGRSHTGWPADLTAVLARIEQRQVLHERITLQVIDMLAVHNEKLDAILEAATREPGPSPVFGVLAEILESLRAQESLLAELPDTLAETIRHEWLREPDIDDEPAAEDPETKAAGSGPLDDWPDERH